MQIQPRVLLFRVLIMVRKDIDILFWLP